MRASKLPMIRPLATSCAAVAILFVAPGCRREEAVSNAPRSGSAPESRAESGPVATWVRIEVDPNPGWDPAEMRRIANRELEVCREVLEKGAGIPFDASRPSIAVRFVHDENTLHDLYRAVPRSERVLSWRGRAFYRSDANHLVLTREAEVPDRTYLFSLALVLTHSAIGPVNLVDSVAMWMSGMAMNRLLGEPFWRRGRVLSDFWDVRLTSARLEEVCLWASLPLPTDLDLTWGRDVITGLDLGHFDRSDMDLGDELRRTSWFLVFFLANFAETGRTVRFDDEPKYGKVLRELLGRSELRRRKLWCRSLSWYDKLISDCTAYMVYVNRKRNLGQARNGVILSVDEAPPNRRGVKTAVPEDDLLK